MRNKVLIKISKTEDRSAIFSAAQTIKPSNFYINEYITKENDNLTNKLRKRKPNFNY